MNIKAAALVYAGENDLKNPKISPVYAYYTRGFPQTYRSIGTRDSLLSNCARLQRKFIDSGIGYSGLNRGIVTKLKIIIFECYVTLAQ